MFMVASRLYTLLYSLRDHAGPLSQWLCHHDNSINIVLYYYYYYYY